MNSKGLKDFEKNRKGPFAKYRDLDLTKKDDPEPDQGPRSTPSGAGLAVATTGDKNLIRLIEPIGQRMRILDERPEQIYALCATEDDLYDGGYYPDIYGVFKGSVHYHGEK